MAPGKVYQYRGLFTIRNASVAVLTAALLITLTATARAATITVNSLADIGALGICVLRDAITAANTMTAMNGCAAGDGNDTIQFGVTGTITLGSTLPQITDSNLTINGPVSPGITIDGVSKVQVMQVASGATVNLNDLTITRGSANDGGGILNLGKLTVTASILSGNTATGECGVGGISNLELHGTLTVINSTFSDNKGCIGGIDNDGMLTITNSIFSGNSSTEGASGAISNAGPLIVTNTTFSGNRAANGGGGAISTGASLTIVRDSTFSGNIAATGGAIDNGGGAETIVTNTTFSGNTELTAAGAPFTIVHV